MFKKRKRLMFTRRKRIKSYFIYEQNDINMILFNTSLFLVISDFVVLRKSGNDYVGRCPFCKYGMKNNYHFRVSERLKLYKCFECGAAGKNASSFLMRYYSKPFDYILRFINTNYHNCKFNLNIKGIVAVKKKNHIDEGLPF